MKLKKIASLMLAGVMAVSMLAGCSNTSGNGGQLPPDDDDGEVTGISADVGALVKEKSDKDPFPSYITFEDSAELDADLAYAAGFADVWDSLLGYVNAEPNKLVVVDGNNIVAADIREELMDAVGAEDGVWIDNIGSDEVLKQAENTSNTMDDAVAVRLYMASSVIGEANLKELIARDLDSEGIDEYLYSTQDGSTQNGSNYNHEYTVSVSTYTKTVNSVGGGIIGSGAVAEDPSVVFVAVQVVRTSTHQ